MVAFMHTGTRLTAGYRYTTLGDATFITVPTATDPHRVYDQVFIDGTYFHNKCLLVACTQTHVIA